MKKIHIIGLSIVALFAVMALSASAAFAEEALWLVSGAEVTTLTSVETIGELLLEDNNVPLIGKAAIEKCSGILVGSIGPKGEGEVTEVQNLSKTKIAVSKLGKLTGGIACTGETNCEGTDAEAWPSVLPFKTELELMSNGQILNLFLSAGYTSKCLFLGAALEDECVGTTGAVMENMTGEGVLGTFNKESELGNCQEGGTASGVIEGNGVTLTLTGLEVTVDSP